MYPWSINPNALLFILITFIVILLVIIKLFMYIATKIQLKSHGHCIKPLTQVFLHPIHNSMDNLSIRFSIETKHDIHLLEHLLHSLVKHVFSMQLMVLCPEGSLQGCISQKIEEVMKLTSIFWSSILFFMKFFIHM